MEKIDTEYSQLREDFANRKTTKQYLPLDQARRNKFKLDESIVVPTPAYVGNKTLLNYSLKEITEFIDWTPFFIAWELHGKFPNILTDEKVGVEATKLYTDAKALLQQFIQDESLQAHGVFGLWPVKKSGDDDVLVNAQMVGEESELHFLRQQIQKAPGQPNMCLADFIPMNESSYMGAFAVTIKGIEKHIAHFEHQHDDYSKIMTQALCDRLAEAFAELLHKKVRTEYWGYASEETLNNEELISEKYQGIRPAPGYPACPDHTEKIKLFELLNVQQEIGIELTESLAMYPASSVCGWYFSHPQSKYFGIGKIEQDQLNDYATRKGMELSEAERWLRPILE